MMRDLWARRASLRRLLLLAALAVLVVGGYYLAPIPGRPVAPGAFLALAEAFFVLASAVLTAVALESLIGGLQEGAALLLPAFRVALLLQTAALVAGAVGAQWAWGAYWSWDPLECWRLSIWLVTAGVALALREVARPGWRTTLALWLVAGYSLLVICGAGALVHWLGLSSLYGV